MVFAGVEDSVVKLAGERLAMALTAMARLHGARCWAAGWVTTGSAAEALRTALHIVEQVCHQTV